MKKSALLFTLFFAFTASLFAQKTTFKESEISLKTPDGTLYGTLVQPATQKTPSPVALLISGSGPTDRNGNNPGMTNNSLKMLAEALAANGIATVRYDKRGVGQSQEVVKAEIDLRFEHFINDAAAWVKQLQQDKRFAKVAILGHSEGSLIGLQAALQTKPAAFVSLCGASMPADSIINMQLAVQPEKVRTEVANILTELRQGKTVSHYSPYLETLFRPTVQPYLISWMKYSPMKDLRKLPVKTLIVQGTTDLQVPATEGKMLAKAKPDAKLVIIEGMNHILKNAPADPEKNMATFSDATLPLAKELVPAIVQFLK